MVILPGWSSPTTSVILDDHAAIQTLMCP